MSSCCCFCCNVCCCHCGPTTTLPPFPLCPSIFGGIPLLLLPLNVILCGFYGFLKHSTTFYVAAIYLLFPRMLACPKPPLPSPPLFSFLFLVSWHPGIHVLCRFLLLVASCSCAASGNNSVSSAICSHVYPLERDKQQRERKR